MTQAVAQNTTVADRFTIQDTIVQRPSCHVVRAIDKKLGDRPVALKFYFDRPLTDEQKELFQQEVEQLRATSHSTLVPVIAGGVHEGQFYIAMELIEGPSLRDEMKSGRQFSESDATKLVAEIARAANELHEHDIVHGHIDARSVLFKQGEARLAGFYPPIIDAVQQGQTSGGRMLVEPAYIAPEQLQGSGTTDGRADIYAMSVMLYELVTGKRPFEAANPLQMAMLRLTEKPPAAAANGADISPLLDSAIAKGLAKDPDERFQSTEDFIDAITGGRSVSKNPLLGADQGGERISTETIAVSMSTDQIKEMLARSATGDSSSAPETPAQDPGGTIGTSSPAPELGATMMATPTSSLLRASFMAMSGATRGTSYVLEKSQAMIGTDPGCDVVVADKKAPPRYAIVVQRENEYFVGPLSGEPLVINGETVDERGEVKLKRGDVLHVGDAELRYVAPGEVFSLDAASVQRSIDKPKSKVGRLLAVVAGIVLAVSGALFYSYSQTVENKRIARVSAAEVKRQKAAETVKKLIAEGDALFRDGNLTEPIGNSAQFRFQQVLELDPDNVYAKQRLELIAERADEIAEANRRRAAMTQRVTRLLDDADRYFEAGAYVLPPGRNARELYRQVKQLDPGNEQAEKRLAEISSIMSRLAGQVDALLDQAEAHIAAGRFVTPEGKNAYAVIKRVNEIEPGNSRAEDLHYRMAAIAVRSGDIAKSKRRVKAMRKSYLTAKSLGVDPEFISKRMRGIDIIRRSKSAVIIYDSGTESKKDAAEGASLDSRYLDTAEVERRLAALALESELNDRRDESFIDLQAR